jgi:tonB-dependent receptor
VTGKLTDENGDELIGGIISVPSTENKGSATDIDGNYRITVKYGTPLIFSYVGFRTKIVLATTNRIDVALVEGM